ncbi:hypothetical protein SETIT_9G398600v2 [Setaria italica]|uniref:Uncharacterized protein n=1 Tax=Setaria italica TaxID=4555 RepID=K4A8M3_SETIT|nr:O-acyltransferase WSD1 [Setaria italica]RCV44735.1 hypothetical protein SETIT_9G398600v2 [Setaria italica]
MGAHGASPLAPPPPLSIDTRHRAGAFGDADDDGGEPLSPTARMFHDFYIVAVVGLGAPIDFEPARAGLEVTLVRHPRFSSIRVMDGPEPRWVPTTVNLDDHIIVPDLDRAAIAADADRALEDYVASLSTLPMDQSRPLWELHVLDFPTSEAASAVAFRIHHALGDGASLVSLLLACTRSAADPKALPAMPSPAPAPGPGARRRARPVYGAPPRPAWSAGALALAAWVLSCALLAWHTLVDVARFVAMALQLVRDPPTLFKGVKGVESRRKRFVMRTFSLDDVKLIKHALGCTVNDVLVGVTSAALSRYYFRKLGDDQDTNNRSTCFRSVLFVNLRPTPGIQQLAKMMESGKHNDLKWGNRLGYIVLPFEIVKHDDPLDYVRNGKKTVDRKKHSFEAIATHLIAETVTKLFGIEVATGLFHRMISGTTVLFSNMIGPAEPIEFYGHPVVYIAPSNFGHPSALTIHWQSYLDTIRIILAVDDAQFLDSHDLLDDFAESLESIRNATSTAFKAQVVKG